MLMKVFANEKDIRFVSTSAKTGNGVNEAFTRLIKEVVLLSKNDLVIKNINQKQKINNEVNNPKEKTCC